MEDNHIAKAALEQIMPSLPSLNCVIYDRACRFAKCGTSTKTLRKVKHWCVDKFHAKGHSKKCACSPLTNATLGKRVENVNTSACEQTFAWFRGYSRTFNTMRNEKQRFMVLSFARKHNQLVRKGDTRHLNAYAAKRQQGRKVGVIKNPSVMKYSCNK